MQYNGIVSADDKELLTIGELAERLKFTVKWIRAQVKVGAIPCIKFNSRTWRFHWPSVVAALQKLQ